MSVSLAAGGAIVLEGPCSSEDAEPLLQLLLSNPTAQVDWRLCTTAHSAVLQVLLAAKPPMLGPPENPALARWMSPILNAAAGQ